MEAGCEAARGFALLWEGQGAEGSSFEDLEAFKLHLSACPDCKREYAALLPFMERDLSPYPFPAIEEVFVRRIMESLPVLAAKRRSQPRPALRLMVAVAAALALVLGGLSLSGAFPSLRDRNTVSIHFSIDAPDASSVVLIGSFSDWSADKGYRLEKAGLGPWELSVRLRKNEVYSYGFLIDGERWMADPQATEAVDDGFGGTNSLLRL
jgi:hypothetical protein